MNNVLCRVKEILETRLSVDEFVSNIEYLVNKPKRDEIIRKYFGKRLLITDRVDWSTTEILQAYREQDCIEKIFRSSKDSEHFSIRPQHHYTDQKIRVHIFCCLLGLTLTTILQKEVLKHGINISKKQLLNKLSEIRRCWLKNKDSNQATNVLEEMDTMQSQLWDAIQSI
jgi:transposase